MFVGNQFLYIIIIPSRNAHLISTATLRGIMSSYKESPSFLLSCYQNALASRRT